LNQFSLTVLSQSQNNHGAGFVFLVGMRSRFHQLYTTGETTDCTKWKEDYKNCVAFDQSDSAADAVSISLFCLTSVALTFGP